MSFRVFFTNGLPLSFAYRSRLYRSGKIDRDRVITIAKAEAVLMFLASFFAACKYWYADYLFGYAQFDVHEGGFIVPIPWLLAKRTSNVGLARLISSCSPDPVLSLLALNMSSEIDWCHYIGDQLLFLRYDLENTTVSDRVATRAAKRQKVCGSVLLHVPGRRIAWLKMAFYASIKSCDLDRKFRTAKLARKTSLGITMSRTPTV